MISIAEFKTNRFWGQIGTSCFQKNNHVLLVTAKLRFAPKAGHANALLPRMRRKAKEWWNTPLVGTLKIVREWHRGNHHALLLPGQTHYGVRYLGKLANVLGISFSAVPERFSHHFQSIFVLHCLSLNKKLWITTMCPALNSALHAKCSTPATSWALMMCQVDK